VSAIRHLVATAVPRLKPSKITLVDNNANLLAPGDAEGDSQGMASTAQEHRIAFERRLKARIETLLAPTLGIDNINAQVSADIDFDRIERNSELYDPESQVAISVRGTSEVETFDEIDGANNVSVANNLPNADSAGGSRNAKRSIEKTDEQTNFAISKTIEKHVKEIGNINRISVAVLVDGSYEQIDGGYLYSDRSPEEIQQIDSLVKSAIGFDEDRGDSVKIVNMRFETEPEPEITESEFDWIKDQFRDIFPSLMFGAVAILAILTVIRPLINRIIEASEQAKRDAEANQEALAGPVALTQLADMSEEEEEESMISIDKIQAKVKSSTYKKINDVIDQHPDEAITVMRQWLVKESS
jgi:flagellar M-ring protein FliF